jgi:hypothetical protein
MMTNANIICQSQQSLHVFCSFFYFFVLKSLEGNGGKGKVGEGRER